MQGAWITPPKYPPKYLEKPSQPDKINGKVAAKKENGAETQHSTRHDCFGMLGNCPNYQNVQKMLHGLFCEASKMSQCHGGSYFLLQDVPVMTHPNVIVR